MVHGRLPTAPGHPLRLRALSYLAAQFGGSQSFAHQMWLFPQPPQIAWVTQPLLLLPERRAFLLYTGVNAGGLALGTYVVLRD